MSQSNHFSDLNNDSLSSIHNNKKQIFEIIDSILSLESCLHYQFLPLGLKDSILTLGMINTKDKNGYNFIYPIVASLNYTLKISEIDSQTHQSILAEYLKRDLSAQSHNNLQSDLNSSLTLTDIPTNLPLINSKGTNLHDRETLIVDPQEELTSDANLENDILSSSPEIFSSEPQITNSDSPELNQSQEEGQSNPNILEVKAEHINESIETLSSLAPEKLWQELLARILDGGIGRLYLERHPDRGRIIWSKDGILQSSLERVEVSVFEHLIQEIKLLGKQSLTPIEKTKKVAVEKFYNGERILIRIEFFVNQYGEEITIQILRDKALKFYEQRQVKRMTEQALSLSYKLEKTLKKMIFCSNHGELNHIKSLKSIFGQIEKQIALLEKKAKNPQD